MGLYIQGVDIPSEHPICLLIRPDGKVEQYATWGFMGEKQGECESVQVPPHGRLGDLDELYASLEKWLIQNRHSMTEATRVWIRGVLEGIAAAPTIIPADRPEKKELR